MVRHALRSALGRAAPQSTTRALGMPISTTTPASFFTTSSSALSDDSNNGNSNNKAQSHPGQTIAVAKLTQLNKRRTNNNNNNTEGTSGKGPRREALASVPGVRTFAQREGGGGGGGGIDARSLRVSPDAAASGSGSGSSGPRVLNLRSLRGGAGLRGGSGLRGRMPFGRGGGEAGGLGRSRFGAGRGGAGAGARGGRFGGGAREGGFGGRTRGGGARFGDRGRGSGRGRGRGRGGSDRADRPKKDDKATTSSSGKVVWSPEEQALINRLDQGEEVRFDPKLTVDSLTGYGAAVASDVPLGQVETALRTMRLMTGGMAFNADSGVTADIPAIMKRYQAKKPIFVHSKAEKAWIEEAQPRLQLVGPAEATKKAIVDTTIRGKYEATGFAEVGDVKATMANYHARTFTYMSSDSQKFMDKVLSLLPTQQGGKAAAQANR